MPGGGMCMWPRLSPWLITTKRYWPGVLNLLSSEGIRVPRGRYAKIY